MSSGTPSNGISPTSIRRCDYTAPAFLVDRIELDFDLDPASTLVVAASQVRRNGPGSAALELDGDSLELVSVEIDGTTLRADEYLLDTTQLRIPAVPDSFMLRVITRLRPASNTSLMGLYVSNGNFFTQCEAQGFRRITFFPDRPDVMARYCVTLRADREHPVLLSNGNLVEQGDCAPGASGRQRHYARWEDPFPKPSYLFAVVAGRLAATERTLRTRSGRNALLQVWVEPGNEDKTAHAMDSLERSIRWDEQRFGLELDLDRFMIVAVGDFNMGAMENKGLNIFNTKYVFATPRIATDTDFVNVESVVGHEYFHNWTGNRVTCRDWFQLTLKEGLTVFRDQEFSADVKAAGCATEAAGASARAVKRIEDVRVLRAAQFPEDSGPMTHPIRPESYQEINNFYTVTVYEKGAEVVRMLQTLVGREGFRAGLDLYFARHDGQAVTCDDFVAAIADANGRDLSQFVHWYSQAGTPRVSVECRHDARARTCTLVIGQWCPPSPDQAVKAPFHIPLAIGLVGRDGHDLPLLLHAGEDSASAPRTRVLELTGKRHEFVFHGIDAPPVPSLARDFSAPVIVEFDCRDEDLAFLAERDSDPFNRWESLQRLALSSMLRALAGTPLREACATFVRVCARLLDDADLDPAFKELALSLPGEGVVAEQLPVVDPVRVREVRDSLVGLLARELAPAWQRTWESLEQTGPYSADSVAVGRRALKNLALSYWVSSADEAAYRAAATQFDGADNMTDRYAALHALLSSPAPQRQGALQAFAREFTDEPLAMDKWFTLQASAHRQPGDAPVLERVRELLGHPAFTLKNPNKVRSLIGAFCNGNLAEFHEADGSGYEFWAQQVLCLDAINPQVAARIARAMDRWRKFTPDRQAAMRVILERMSAHPKLSNDVREIIDKALAG